MIDGIRQSLTYLEPGARKGSKADGSASVPRAGALAPATSGADAFVDVTSASSGGAAPLDRARIDAIREAIRNNAYPIDFEQLADRMIDLDVNRRSDRAF